MKIRCCLVGACKTGKSHFVGVLKDYDCNTYNATIGVDFCTYKHKHHTLHFWDTSGSENFKTITYNFVQTVNVLVAVYKDKESYNWLKKFFHDTPIKHIEKIFFVYSGKREEFDIEIEHYFIHCTYTKESVQNCVEVMTKILNKGESSPSTRSSYCFWFS